MKKSEIGNLTLFPVEDKATQLEFSRLRDLTMMPVGGRIKFIGNPIPFGYRSLDSDLTLSKAEFSQLYSVVKGVTGVTETDAHFTIAADSNFIIRVS